MCHCSAEQSNKITMAHLHIDGSLSILMVLMQARCSLSVSEILPQVGHDSLRGRQLLSKSFDLKGLQAIWHCPEPLVLLPGLRVMRHLC